MADSEDKRDPRSIDQYPADKEFGLMFQGLKKEAVLSAENGFMKPI